MATDMLIIRLFCMIDDRLGRVKNHPLARLYPSEVVTIGLLFALKGISYRALYRWLHAHYALLFGALPEQSRLLRLLQHAQRYTDQFLAAPTVLGILDSIGIELIHPRREGRNCQPIVRKGISNHHWIVGVKLAWLINWVKWFSGSGCQPMSSIRNSGCGRLAGGSNHCLGRQRVPGACG